MIALIDDHQQGTGIHSYHAGIYSNLISHGLETKLYELGGSPWRVLLRDIGWRMGITIDRALRGLNRINAVIHVSNPNLAQIAKFAPTVVTVHDLYYLDNYSNNRLWSAYSRHNYRYIGLARRIVANSNETASQVVKRLGYDQGMISVVHPFISSTFSPVGPRLALFDGKKVLLHVGYDMPNKNIALILSALSILPKDYVLVRVGHESSATLKLIGRMGLNERVIHMRAETEEKLAQIYRSSRTFVFPSKYEGFGIPPLEAMACGVPVIASQMGGLKEAVGDAAVIIDPRDPRQLADAVLSLEDEAFYSKMRERGLKRSRGFGADAQFSELMQAYRKAYPELSIP